MGGGGGPQKMDEKPRVCESCMRERGKKSESFVDVIWGKKSAPNRHIVGIKIIRHEPEATWQRVRINARRGESGRLTEQLQSVATRYKSWGIYSCKFRIPFCRNLALEPQGHCVLPPRLN